MAWREIIGIPVHDLGRDGKGVQLPRSGVIFRHKLSDLHACWQASSSPIIDPSPETHAKHIPSLRGCRDAETGWLVGAILREFRNGRDRAESSMASAVPVATRLRTVCLSSATRAARAIGTAYSNSLMVRA